ncbi:MAG: NADH-quinone oxidoreductase subunit M [Pseudomonadota bacterium]
MEDLKLLSLIVCLPLLGAALLAGVLRGDDAAAQLNAKRFALLITTATFFLSLFLLTGFDPENPDFQFVEDGAWLGGLRYKLGLDGISLPFLMLTAFIFPICVLASWSLATRVKEFMALLLVLESMIIGVFASLDIVLFFVFFEGALIPMFLLIGIWGGGQRVYAAFKFFLCSMVGSIALLIALAYMASDAGTTCIAACAGEAAGLLDHQFAFENFTLAGIEIVGGTQTLLWLAFFISFAVKTPMWPFHTWLPDAHAAAPIAASVVLGALMLKFGGYGFLRFSLPMFPVATDVMAAFAIALSLVAIVYASLVALMQEDLKRLFAYLSIAQMGFVTMGIFASNKQALDGAVFQMLSHGILIAGLFLCAGVLQNRSKSTEISAFGGLATRMPIFAGAMLLFILAVIGLPGTSGFVGEFLAIIGVFQVASWAAFGAALGLVISAGYGIWVYRRVFLGSLLKENLKQIRDIDGREAALILPLAVLVVALGVYPTAASDLFGPTIDAMLENLEEVRASTTDFAQFLQ